MTRTQTMGRPNCYGLGLALFGLTLISVVAPAQTKLDKTIPVKSGQEVRMSFDYLEMIRVSTWDRNEISIQGSVSINAGESDDAFVLDISPSGNIVDIRGKIRNMDDLPKRITVYRDGVKLMFRNEGEWEKYRKENGTHYDRMNHGLDIDITLEIKVPARTPTSVTSVYGMVEVRQFNGALKVAATYGGVDASITESQTGDLVAETNYGHIFSDLTTTFDRDRTREEDFHTIVSVKPGTGPAYRFESTYGNVYLRRTK